MKIVKTVTCILMVISILAGVNAILLAFYTPLPYVNGAKEACIDLAVDMPHPKFVVNELVQNPSTSEFKTAKLVRDHGVLTSSTVELGDKDLVIVTKNETSEVFTKKEFIKAMTSDDEARKKQFQDFKSTVSGNTVIISAEDKGVYVLTPEAVQQVMESEVVHDFLKDKSLPDLIMSWNVCQLIPAGPCYKSEELFFLIGVYTIVICAVDLRFLKNYRAESKRTLIFLGVLTVICCPVGAILMWILSRECDILV